VEFLRGQMVVRRNSKICGQCGRVISTQRHESDKHVEIGDAGKGKGAET
jgi:hypothetical protein